MSPAKQRALTIGLIVLGIVIVGFFGIRAIHAFRHIRDGKFGPGHPPPPPSQTDVELIRDWMTIAYISRAYGVPDHMLFNELKIPEQGNLKKSLKTLNDRYYPNQAGFVLAEIKKAIDNHRPPAPPVTPTP